MKINWGVGIVIAFGLFITFILYFVVMVQSDSKYDNDLVVEEYYKHDAKFGDEMARIQNA
nr:FixH family protein [Flavobacterium sp.]